MGNELDLDDCASQSPLARKQLADLRELIASMEHHGARLEAALIGGCAPIDICVVAAWMNAELSEGQAARALGLDRLSARILRDKIVAVGIEVFALVNLGGTPESARDAIMAYAARQEPQRVCAHCNTQIIPAGLTECPKCDKPVMP